MEFDGSNGPGPSQAPRPRVLRIAIWLVAIPATCELISLAFGIYVYLYEFVSSSIPSPPFELNQAVYSITTLAAPLLVIAAALLLFAFIEVRPGLAAWGRNLLVAGAAIFTMGALFNVVSYLRFWQTVSHGVSQVDLQSTVVAEIVSSIGVFIAVLATALLLVSYARGLAHLRPK